MGSFNTLYEFISNRVRVLPKDGDNADDHHTPAPASVLVANSNYSYQRYYSDSNAALLQKEAIQELFPCDDRHSFNPHYQHNLHSTDNASLPYSTPPSLSSSPTDSSPSSTTSASSRRSQNNSYYPARHYHYQQQQQQQQQQPHLRRSASNGNTKSSYSYHRHQTRRQNQRNHANHGQYYEYMDDDMMIGSDNPHQNNSNRFSISSSSSTSMSRVHPQGSSSYTSISSSTNSDLRFSSSMQGRRTISSLPSASENERRMVAPFSMPSFPAAAIEDAAAGEGSSRSSRPALSTIAESTQPSKAQLSLMRIAQCDRRVDSWCTQQAGQWTRHYAETTSCGVMADGRRTRRM